MWGKIKIIVLVFFYGTATIFGILKNKYDEYKKQKS